MCARLRGACTHILYGTRWIPRAKEFTWQVSNSAHKNWSGVKSKTTIIIIIKIENNGNY